MDRTIRNVLLIALVLLSASVVVVAMTTYTDWLAPGNSQDYYYQANSTPLNTNTVINTLGVTGNENSILADIRIEADGDLIDIHEVIHRRVEDYCDWGAVDFSATSYPNNQITHHIADDTGMGGQAFFKTNIDD